MVLVLTGAAKIISAAGSARILKLSDPILGVPFYKLFLILGAAEIAIALLCLKGKNLILQSALVAWLSASFLFYRLGLLWVGFGSHCPCLGNLTDSLHIPPQTAEWAANLLLAYLLIGSYSSLFLLFVGYASPPSHLKFEVVRTQ